MTLEKTFSILLFAIVSIFVFLSFQLSFLGSSGVLGSGFFPQIVTSLLLILCIIYIIKLFKPKPNKQDTADSSIKVELYFVLGLAITLTLVHLIGMMAALLFFTYITNIIFGKRSWRQSLIFSIVFVFGLNLIFRYGLNIRLPSGLLF